MQKNICAVNGEGAVTDRACRKWFVKFCAGDFSLDDAPQTGRPAEKLIAIKLRHSLRTINIIAHGRQLTYSKYTNQ